MNRIGALAACVFLAGCTLEDGSAPQDLTAPSEFALSVTMTAAPDSVPRDGASQSVVTVTVRDAAGSPVAGQRLTLTTTVGSLSDSSVTTGSGGQASFTFTAPPAATVGSGAVIGVVPIGTDGANAAQRNLTIRFTGTTNRSLPTPAFTVTPDEPEANLAVRFDASTTTDEGAPCLEACSYSWNFGDGSTGSGRIVNHTFTAGRTYTVTLTVTDAAGSSASIARQVVVAAIEGPTVDLTFAPATPLAGQPTVFTADAEAADGHSIVRYEWDFGDGTSQTTTSGSVSKTYASRGTYVVRVTVTDDTGQTASDVVSFSITTSGATASFTVSPSDPETGTTVTFNGSASTGSGGAEIVEWSWDFGNGVTDEQDDPTTSTSYGSPGTYTVTLTVTDSNDRTGTTTKTVTVSEPD
jgi:PKD repeat protein